MKYQIWSIYFVLWKQFLIIPAIDFLPAPNLHFEVEIKDSISFILYKYWFPREIITTHCETICCKVQLPQWRQNNSKCHRIRIWIPIINIEKYTKDPILKDMVIII